LIIWTIGAGGLLGSAIQRHVERSFEASSIPWREEQRSKQVLANNYRAFKDSVGTNDWAIIWAAGAATVSASTEAAEQELRVLESLLREIAANPPAGKGVFFLSSSAGGVYAGSSNPPFDVSTMPISLSPYGEFKIKQELATTEILASTCAVVIGRFSNLYGPGQNLDKLQGLISRLALAAATRQPINIFVSLDTIRDYIYVDDAARIALQWVDQSINEPSTTTTAIIASGEPTVLGQLIRLVQDVARTKVPVALGTHSSSAAQVSDLRLVPTPTRESELTRMSLPAGVKLVYQDILARAQGPVPQEAGPR
jgi:UDP-glucose 4-epimerase